MKWIIGKKYKYKGYELSNMHDTADAEHQGILIRGNSYVLVQVDQRNATGTVQMNGRYGTWTLGLRCLEPEKKLKPRNLPSWW